MSNIFFVVAFFIDVLTFAEILSLQTQKHDISIIDIVDCVDTTKRNYKTAKTIWKWQK